MFKIFILGAFVFASTLTFGQVMETKAPVTEPNPKEKTRNITVSPLMPLLLSLKASVEFKVNSTTTIGPEVSYWGFANNPLGVFGETKKSEGHLTTLSIFAKRYFAEEAFSSSWYTKYILGGYYYKEYDDNSYGSGSFSRVNFHTSFLGGYHWFFESGFNMDLGLGLGISGLQGLLVPFPELSFNLGYIF